RRRTRRAALRAQAGADLASAVYLGTRVPSGGAPRHLRGRSLRDARRARGGGRLLSRVARVRAAGRARRGCRAGRSRALLHVGPEPRPHRGALARRRAEAGAASDAESVGADRAAGRAGDGARRVTELAPIVVERVALRYANDQKASSNRMRTFALFCIL